MMNPRGLGECKAHERRQKRKSKIHEDTLECRRRAFVYPSEKAKPSYRRGGEAHCGEPAKSWVYAEYREQTKASKTDVGK